MWVSAQNPAGMSLQFQQQKQQFEAICSFQASSPPAETQSWVTNTHTSIRYEVQDELEASNCETNCILCGVVLYLKVLYLFVWYEEAVTMGMSHGNISPLIPP